MNLSVIIPVGTGRRDNLRNCLYSLTRQTLAKQQWEVIIVQDGCDEDLLPALDEFQGRLDMRFIRTPKFEPRQDMPPRNKGARLARYPFLVFMDSDIILNPDALEMFARDFVANPDRVVGGLYDWLPPAHITNTHIDAGLDAIYALDERTDMRNGTPFTDLHIRLLVPARGFPQGYATHNVCRDMRRPMFLEREPDYVYYGPGHLNAFLGAFSGLIGYPTKLFWEVGGFWEDIYAGLADDGALGLTLWASGKGISFDPRIRGAHQYHDRNTNWVVAQSRRDVDLINRRFGLEQYADGRRPVLPRPVFELTAEAHKAWGVSRWSEPVDSQESANDGSPAS